MDRSPQMLNDQDLSPKRANSDDNRPDIKISAVAAVFVSLIKLQGQRYAFFTASLPNAELQETQVPITPPPLR